MNLALLDFDGTITFGDTWTPFIAVLLMVNGQALGGPVTLIAKSRSTAQATVVLASHSPFLFVVLSRWCE